MRIVLTLAAAILTIAANAAEPAGEVPMPRERATAPAAEEPAPLPRPRPASGADAPASGADAPAGPVKPEVPAPPQSGKPQKPAGPPRIYQTACPAVLAGRVEAKTLPPLRAGGQCGERSPLAVTGVLANGRMVPVSGGVETDCGMASALPEWIGAIDSYVLAREDTRIAEVLVGTSYMCRNVDSATGGNLSFHGLADALDVVGFRLEDGRTVTVEAGWGDALSPEGRLLRFAHGAACANFTTVLGPEANADHRDHLHVDLGCHGRTCTARLCE